MANINFKLIKAHTVRVKGHVSQNLMTGHTIVMLSLVPRSGDTQSMIMSMNRGRTADPKGNFELTGVAPGQYYLRATTNDGNRGYSGRVPVDVGNVNVEGVSVTINPGLTLKGQINIEDTGAGSSQPLSNLRAQLLPRDAGPIMFNMSSGKVGEDGSFKLENVTPEVYNLSLYGLPDGYYLKSARFGDTEVLTAGLDLTAGGAQPLTLTISGKAGASHRGRAEWQNPGAFTRRNRRIDPPGAGPPRPKQLLQADGERSVREVQLQKHPAG